MAPSLGQICWLLYQGRYTQVWLVGPAARVVEPAPVFDCSRGMVSCVYVGVGSTDWGAAQCYGGPFDGDLCPHPAPANEATGWHAFLGVCARERPTTVTVYRWTSGIWSYDSAFTSALRSPGVALSAGRLGNLAPQLT